MRVSDTLSPIHAVRSLVRVKVEHTTSEQAAVKVRDVVARPDFQHDRGTSETDSARYGELLLRPPRAPEKVVSGPAKTPANIETASNANGPVTRISHGRAIDIYETLQAHTTPQSLSLVHRVDLYA